MPLPMVHLIVASELLRENGTGLTDKGEFCLGNIVPDSIHMRDGWDIKDKQISHLGLRGADSERAFECAGRFISEYKNDMHRDYFYGYVVHILTDVLFVETVFAKFYQRYIDDGGVQSKYRSAYYRDAEQLDFILYESFDLRNMVWDLLKDARGMDVNGLISAKEADSWKYRVLSWFDKPCAYDGGVKYISEKDLNDFFPLCIGRISHFLKSR